MPERHRFPWILYGLTHLLVIISITGVFKRAPIWTRWSIFLPIAVFSCYLVCYTTTGGVMVAHGLGTAILFQLMVAADYIIITGAFTRRTSRQE